jgi:carboxyl-terminal processing protease
MGLRELGPALWIASAALLAPRAAWSQGSDYEADVRFAVEQIETQCAALLRSKEIDWPKVSKPFLKEAADVENDSQHLVLLTRLLARLEDGHCTVQPLERGKDVKWPEEPERTGAGMAWCKSGKKILVKNVWNVAGEVGLEPGMEVLSVDGTSVSKWLDARIVELRDVQSFSTDQHAFFFATHWGLGMPVGTRLKLELKGVDGKKSKRTLTYEKAALAPWGPAVFPDGLQGDEDVRWVVLPSGAGYVHLRRCKGDLPERMDEALAKLGNVPGLVLDFRANGGGGFDHDAFLGRFVPAGKQLAFTNTYPSAGPNPYGGPIVVIVDGNCRSAGETASGMFKEDGRAYMIGESPTAGMSSSKTTIELPSRLFALYVSIASNKGRFNGGKGIEGIGVIPHEIVEYQAKDLAAGIDTLTARAEALLADFPHKDVPYDPAKFGWEPPDGRD